MRSLHDKNSKKKSSKVGVASTVITPFQSKHLPRGWGEPLLSDIETVWAGPQGSAIAAGHLSS